MALLRFFLLHTIAGYLNYVSLQHITPMASKLQKRDLDIYQAYNMIDQTKERISAVQDEIDEEYGVWYEDAVRLATLLGRQRANAPSTSPKEYYLSNLAIPFCDHLSADFQSRFNSKSRK